MRSSRPASSTRRSSRRRDGPAPGGERGRVRPRRGPRRADSDPRPARPGRAGGRVARLARVHRPRDRRPAVRRPGPGLGRPGARRARAGRGRRRAPRRGRGLPRRPRQPAYPVLLPAMVRTALGIGEPALAERLVGGLEPRYPYAEHALVAANAALAEARGDLQAAADAYADAADRWERFGVVPEQAFALLGQGRCLLGLVPTDRGRTRPPARPRDLRSGSRRPPRSPRPTRSCSRRPRSVHRAILVNTWSRSRPYSTVLTGTPVTSRIAPHLRRCRSDVSRTSP